MNLVTPGSRRLIAAGISFSIMVMLSACGGGRNARVVVMSVLI